MAKSIVHKAVKKFFSLLGRKSTKKKAMYAVHQGKKYAFEIIKDPHSKAVAKRVLREARKLEKKARPYEKRAVRKIKKAMR